MLREITLPEDYSGTIKQENSIIEDVNYNFHEIEKQVSELPDKSIKLEEHVVDFEKYEIDIYFSENKNKANLYVKDNTINIEINDKHIKISADGNIV